MSSRSGSAGLTFGDFFGEGDRQARMRWDWNAETTVCHGLDAGRHFVAWECDGRRVRISQTLTNTVIAELYGTARKALPGNTIEIGLTHCGVQDLVALLTWLGTHAATAA